MRAVVLYTKFFENWKDSNAVIGRNYTYYTKKNTY